MSPNKPIREQLQDLAFEESFNEIVSILEAESKQRKLELHELLTKSRAIQLGDDGPLPLSAASEAVKEALERDPEYLPALIERAYYLDAFEGEAEAAIGLFETAADVVLELLLEVIRGWAEAKLLDDEVRKEMLRSYNRLLQSLGAAGLAAGKPARKLYWTEDSEEI